jgi:hypothetical protein
MFRALLAHPQEALYKRHLVYCVRVMSVVCIVSSEHLKLQALGEIKKEPMSSKQDKGYKLSPFWSLRHSSCAYSPPRHVAAYTVILIGRDSSVDIAIRYRLDCPRIESQWGRDFPHPSRPALGPTQPPVHWEPGKFPGDKVAGGWSWPPTAPFAEVKERVEL